MWQDTARNKSNQLEKHFRFGVWKFVRFHATFFDMLDLQSGEHLHAVVYHFDTLASSFSKSQIYIYSNVFSAVKVDTA